MRRKTGIWKKSLSLFLAASMLAGTASVLSGCGIGSSKNKTIKLDVYSQLTNSSGMQTGWSAQILKEKFNVELNIINDADGVFGIIFPLRKDA